MKLSSTSALVLLWSGREHLRGRAARAYFDRLDLEEGRTLRDRCEAVCPYYAEVIRNRKHGVLNFIGQALAAAGDEPAQVVIAGAGLDPLGLELAERHPDVAVFEIDRENMDVKQKLFREGGATQGPHVSQASEPAQSWGSSQGSQKPQEHQASHTPSVALVTADLADAAAVRRGLVEAGWRPGRFTVLLLEGVSYYLAPEALRALVATVRPDAFVVEYLKPAAAIASDRAAIPEQVFGVIAQACALPEIRRHDTTTLRALLDEADEGDKAGERRGGGLTVVARHGMAALERQRTDANRFFATEDSGWIEVALMVRSRNAAGG